MFSPFESSKWLFQGLLNPKWGAFLSPKCPLKILLWSSTSCFPLLSSSFHVWVFPFLSFCLFLFVFCSPLFLGFFISSFSFMFWQVSSIMAKLSCYCWSCDKLCMFVTVGYWTSSTAGGWCSGDVMIGGQCHKWHCWRSLNMCLTITVVQLCLKSWFFHLFFSFEFHLTKLIPGMLSYLKHLCHYQVLSVLLRTQKVGMENISIFWSWILCSLTLWWFEPATICKATQGIAIGYRLHAAWNLNDWQLSWKPG